MSTLQNWLAAAPETRVIQITVPPTGQGFRCTLTESRGGNGYVIAIHQASTIQSAMMGAGAKIL